jgi:dethiobiotin synthetase
MSPRVLFVAGAHTEIGKTHVVSGLLRAAAEEGWKVDALKPVVSGLDPEDWSNSDPGRLLTAMGRSHSDEALEALSPWRYRAPLAPPLAARLEDQALDFEPVVDFCRRRIATTAAGLMLVEGVGGLMSPIAEGATSLDLLEALAGSNLLVGGGYLGAVSHTLTALEVMRARGVAPAALVISESGDPDAPNFLGTLSMLTEYAGETPVIPASRQAGYAWASLALKAVTG